MYIYGKNVLKERISSGKEIRKVYLAKDFRDKEFLDLLKEIKIPIISVDRKQLDKMVSQNHQGVILEIEDFEYSSLEEVLSQIDKPYPLLVMLDHLEDPHNLGAIIRTSEALGVDGIILPNKRSVLVNGTVMKTSAGAIHHIPIILVSNLVNTINTLKKEGYWIVGSDMSSLPYDEIDYKMPVCLVIGNEGTGISKLVLENCDYVVSIPMSGKVNSLNASVATGILLSEIVLKRK